MSEDRTSRFYPGNFVGWIDEYGDLRTEHGVVARITVGDTSMPQRELLDGLVRPGDAIEIQPGDDADHVVRTRKYSWWRRWPWARIEHTVICTFKYAKD